MDSLESNTMQYRLIERVKEIKNLNEREEIKRSKLDKIDEEVEDIEKKKVPRQRSIENHKKV